MWHMGLLFFLSSTTVTPSTASVDRFLTSVTQSTFSKVENYTAATPPDTTMNHNDQSMDIILGVIIAFAVVAVIVAVIAVAYCRRKRKYIFSTFLLKS